MHLKQVFDRSEEFGITINISKCTFEQETVEFLGHEVTTEGIRPLEEKVQEIMDFPRPTTVDKLSRYVKLL